METDPKKAVAVAAPGSPPGGAGGRVEPDAEPESEHKDFLCSYVQDHAEHRDFVHRLRRSHTVAPEREHFWSEDDVEQGSPMLVSLEELKRYFADWESTGQDPFWHRKSGQVVLATVVCRRADGTLGVYRGMNTEVSLPAGSLCAERAGVARAASDFQAACTIEAVAVLDPKNKINPLWPCEVCQSWLAKLRDQSSAIKVIAVSSSACESFLLRVNGHIVPPPRPTRQPPPELAEKVERAEGTEEWPWEAERLVYVDGSWASLTTTQRRLLKAARARGSHLLVGVHSDETLREQLGEPPSEDAATRLERVLGERHVSSVLKDAPWAASAGMLVSLGIASVVTSERAADGERCKDDGTPGVYDAARAQGVLEVIPLSGLSG
mmetsp:Transcript_55079/g.160749  ORF Transcript_55079/g.160749 Transcript_55079/m.160749 type:complete len:380 (-) Transcript_55079:214-1353(-)